jgi:hypothetical protein
MPKINTKKTKIAKSAKKIVAKSAERRKEVSQKAKRHAKKLVVPGKHNDYRPRLIGRWGMLIIAILVGVVYCGHLYFKSEYTLGAQAEITRSRLLAATNEERAANGGGELVLSEKLSEAAEMKARDMFAKQYWSHDAPDGTKPWKWLAEVGYSYEIAGENLAKGFSSAEAVVKAWMDSDTHRENMLKLGYTEVGFAAVDGTLEGKSATLVVALYGQPAIFTAEADVPNTGEMVLGSVEASEGLFGQVKRGFQSATPSLVFILIALGIAAAVSVIAHTYRKQLPKALRQTWYKHHALFKLAFFILLGAGAVLSYGGGMI